LTLGFDPARASSLLPGLLAATRTGLAPAGDDELMSDHDLHIDLQLWPHPRQVATAWKLGPPPMDTGRAKSWASARSYGGPGPTGG
jgi:hypothetical protein